MRLSQFKERLQGARAVNFILPDGTFVPRHYHITEVGLVTKHFIDCGGTVRMDRAVSFQIWVAGDYDHRLQADKLLKIISLSERLLGQEDLDIEVEYQSGTIGKYGLNIKDENFILTPMYTDCLAQDACGIPQDRQKVKLSQVQTGPSSCCTPGGGCC